MKAEYKSATGNEYILDRRPVPGVSASASSDSGNVALYDKVAAQGDKVRDLKSKKAAKVLLNARYSHNIYFTLC